MEWGHIFHTKWGVTPETVLLKDDLGLSYHSSVVLGFSCQYLCLDPQVEVCTPPGTACYVYLRLQWLSGYPAYGHI